MQRYDWFSATGLQMSLDAPATRRAISPLFLRYFLVISPLFLRFAIEGMTLKERRTNVENAGQVGAGCALSE
jgi:hypothetical protein